jgi:hypothetical protein
METEVYSVPIKTKCTERKYTNNKIHRVKLQGSTVISNTLETLDSGKSVLFSESFIHDASTPFCNGSCAAVIFEILGLCCLYS